MTMSAPHDRHPAVRRVFWLSILLAVAGCATVPADFKQPGVAVMSITPRLSEGIAPEFDIVLRVSNPNRSALVVRGLSYTVALAGTEVVQGVASDLPRIEAYGEGEVTLLAKPDLLGGLSVLSRILTDPASPVEFEFSAEIDVGAFYPLVKVNKRGTVAFR